MPANPEGLEFPKQAMVNLARRSRRRDIRLDMAPHDGSGRTEGPAYASRMIEFATDRWRPEVAAAHADSLRRAIDRLRQLCTGSA